MTTHQNAEPRPPTGEAPEEIKSQELLRGHKMSDAVAIIGSTDIVLGCVDR